MQVQWYYCIQWNIIHEKISKCVCAGACMLHVHIYARACVYICTTLIIILLIITVSLQIYDVYLIIAFYNTHTSLIVSRLIINTYDII